MQEYLHALTLSQFQTNKTVVFFDVFFFTPEKNISSDDFIFSVLPSYLRGNWCVASTDVAFFCKDQNLYHARFDLLPSPKPLNLIEEFTCSLIRTLILPDSMTISAMQTTKSEYNIL